MRIQSAVLSTITAAAALGFGLVAKADTVPAHCDLYAPREDYPSLSSACTFRNGRAISQWSCNRMA